MNPKSQVRLKPFSQYNHRLVVDALMDVSPKVFSLKAARRGVGSAIKKLRSIVLGVVAQDDIPKIAPGVATLAVEANYALLAAIAIVGHSTESLNDLIEYNAFETIALPESGGHEPVSVLWNDNVTVAVSRHYAAVSMLRQMRQSAPRYRKAGHDYCEDMIEMCCRTIMRPAVVNFSRFLEKSLGWPSVERSGVLSHVHLTPKYERSVGGTQ